MNGKRRRGRVVTVVAAIVLCLPLFGLVPSASAHVDAPTVTAQHAFIGDPLWDLGTSAGKLFGIEEDERTAMASTTKLMTLDVTLHAVEDGIVSLNDPVTVDSFAASLEPGNSVMATISDPFCMFDSEGQPVTTPPTAFAVGSACVTLEPGEVVSLETLIRGMMYPSGNDAAWAIADYVAQAYGDDTNRDSAIDGNDFVERMNQHAADIGLTDTHFTSANGWDDPASANPDPEDLNHYTTARELAMTIHHGLDAHEHFGEVIGFQGTYTDTSQGPNGTKTYQWGWGSNYPGWEGAKGGGTQNCNGGPNGYCVATSARRIGRRVVIAAMQAMGSTLQSTMLDYGFAQVFHPDPRGMSSSGGAAEKHDVACLYDGRAVSAVLPPSGDVRLVSWQPNVDASNIAKLGEASLPGSALPPKAGQGMGPQGDVAVAELPSGALILAFRKGANIELSRWSIAGDGSLTVLQSGVKAGPATSMALQPVYGDMFVTAFTDPDGVLVVKSWRLEGGSGIVHLDTYRDESRVYSQVAIAGPLNADVYNGHRAASAAVAGGDLVHHVWGVDPTTGVITPLGELLEDTSTSNVSIAPLPVETVYQGELFPPVYYATAFWSDGGNSLIRFYRIDPTGTPVEEGGTTPTATKAYDLRLAPLGVSGMIQSVRDEDGDGEIELRVFEAARQADNSIATDRVAEHDEPAAFSPELCRVPSTHAEGDYVVASTDPLLGELRLRAHRSGDRP